MRTQLAAPVARVGVDNVNDSSNLNIHKQVPEAPFPPGARGGTPALDSNGPGTLLRSPVSCSTPCPPVSCSTPCPPVTISFDNYERPLFR